MKRFILVILALSLLISFAGAELVDRIVAKVGSEVILLSDIQKMLLQMRAAGLTSTLLLLRSCRSWSSNAILQKAKERNSSQ